MIGLTVLRLAEVQQPKITATFSCVMSRSASVANVGQSDFQSTTIGSIFLPSNQPAALI